MTFTPADYGRLADLLERDGLSKETQRYLSMVNARIILAALRAMADGGAFAAGARAGVEAMRAALVPCVEPLGTYSDTPAMQAELALRVFLTDAVRELNPPIPSAPPPGALPLDPVTWRKACEAAAKECERTQMIYKGTLSWMGTRDGEACAAAIRALPMPSQGA